MIQVYIDIQKHDLGRRGIPKEFGGIVAVEAFKELGVGVGTMRPENEDLIV
jgi:hypothetical protein